MPQNHFSLDFSIPKSRCTDNAKILLTKSQQREPEGASYLKFSFFSWGSLISAAPSALHPSRPILLDLTSRQWEQIPFSIFIDLEGEY